MSEIEMERAVGETIHRWRDPETGLRFRLRDDGDGAGPACEVLEGLRGEWRLMRARHLRALESELASVVRRQAVR